MFSGIPESFDQPFSLFILGDVEKEFEDYSTVARQMPLEGVDIGEAVNTVRR